MANSPEGRLFQAYWDDGILDLVGGGAVLFIGVGYVMEQILADYTKRQGDGVLIILILFINVSERNLTDFILRVKLRMKDINYQKAISAGHRC